MLNSNRQPIMFLIFAAGTASDLSVAIAMCVLLSGARTGFRKYEYSLFQITFKRLTEYLILIRTDSLIKSLIVYSINTGSIVAYVPSISTHNSIMFNIDVTPASTRL